ncbi:MAG: lytic transglycosylase domain-containing protein [Sphingomonas sp.]
MAALTRVIAALALAVATPGHARSVADWRTFTAEASRRFGVPVAWIERVMRVESGGHTTLGGHPIRSPAGAIGLMQLMPGTWTAMRKALGLGTDPDDPHDNILAGTFYLRLMYDRFGYPGLFAAYNAGPARYIAWRDGIRPLPAETVAYLGAVAGPSSDMHVPSPRRRSGTLFALGGPVVDTPAAIDPEQEPSPLFVIRRDGR